MMNMNNENTNKDVLEGIENDQKVCTQEWARDVVHSKKSIILNEVNMDDNRQNIKEALVLYDKTHEFLKSLLKVLKTLTNNKKSASALPFNSFLLLQRLQDIILFL